MKRMTLFLAVLFMTLPVMAASNVTISCEKVGNEVTVSYESDANLIRAFGLDITVADANITSCVPVDANYRIYPGQIEIDEGEVTDYNFPYASDDIGDVNLTIEMGSLYTLDSNYASDPCVGYGMKPGKSGTLLIFSCDDDSFNYLITENARRGGIVMENPYEEPNVDLEDCNQGGPVDCFPSSHADYAQWLKAEKPDCWCAQDGNQVQCYGDADGLVEVTKQGSWRVGLDDLNILSDGWQRPDKQDGDIYTWEQWRCADFDHQEEVTKQGTWRVGLDDLNILSWNWQNDNATGPPDPNYGPVSRNDCISRGH